MVPLDIHPGAMPAALAYLCAPVEKRDQFAEALYKIPPQLLEPTTIAGVAAGLDMDGKKMRACMQSDETRAALEQGDLAAFERIGIQALPLTFVDDRVIMGMNVDRFEKAVAVAGKKRPQLPPAAMVIAVALALAAVAYASWKQAPRPA